jgi:hypothetical protein
VGNAVPPIAAEVIVGALASELRSAGVRARPLRELKTARKIARHLGSRVGVPSEQAASA